jgi:transposase-like protein
MQRRKFSREFKLEAVRLVKDRGVAVAQAARDLDVHENVLRKWVRELSGDPQHAFPGHGQMKREPLAVSAHLARRDRARQAIPLRPLHRRGNCNTETRGHKAAAFTGLKRRNYTLV